MVAELGGRNEPTNLAQLHQKPAAIVANGLSLKCFLRFQELGGQNPVLFLQGLGVGENDVAILVLG